MFLLKRFIKKIFPVFALSSCILWFVTGLKIFDVEFFSFIFGVTFTIIALSVIGGVSMMKAEVKAKKAAKEIEELNDLE